MKPRAAAPVDENLADIASELLDRWERVRQSAAGSVPQPAARESRDCVPCLLEDGEGVWQE